MALTTGEARLTAPSTPSAGKMTWITEPTMGRADADSFDRFDNVLAFSAHGL